MKELTFIRISLERRQRHWREMCTLWKGGFNFLSFHLLVVIHSQSFKTSFNFRGNSTGVLKILKHFCIVWMILCLCSHFYFAFYLGYFDLMALFWVSSQLRPALGYRFDLRLHHVFNSREQIKGAVPTWAKHYSQQRKKPHCKSHT